MGETSVILEGVENDQAKHSSTAQFTALAG